MKIFYLLLLSFITQVSYSQCDDSLILSEVEKDSFVRIYLSTKNENPQSQDALLYDLTTKYSITPQQFQEIQNPSEFKRSLSENEQVFISELQNLKIKHKAELKLIKENKCLELKLEHSTYLAMHHQYRSCMRFQRSLSDYFKKWMK